MATVGSADQKSADKMICPRCGAEMNHHCDKLVYATGQETPLQESAQSDPVTDPVIDPSIDPLLGGVISEFHTCPKCGSAACRII
jgi:ribosomal protein S27AE